MRAPATTTSPGSPGSASAAVNQSGTSSITWRLAGSGVVCRGAPADPTLRSTDPRHRARGQPEDARGRLDPTPPPLRAVQLLWWAFVAVVLALTLVVPLAADASLDGPRRCCRRCWRSRPASAGWPARSRSTAACAATPPADDAEAVTQLRSRLVLQLAIIDAPVLLGVAMAFVLGPAVGGGGGRPPHGGRRS